MTSQSRRSLHILFVGIAWPPETFLVRLLRGLLSRGVQVTIACQRRPDPEWLSLPGFHWFQISYWEGFPPFRLIRLGCSFAHAALLAPSDLRTFGLSVKNLSERAARLPAWNRILPFAGKRWDIIYFPWNFGAVDHLPLFDLGMPVVVSCRGAHINIAPHDPRQSRRLGGLRATFERAVAVHCVSHDIMLNAQQFGLDSSRAQVIRPAVDPDDFQPPEAPRVPGDAFRLVTTGSLIWRKGYEYALSTVRLLKDEGIPVQFQIIGEGPERQRILYTIHDLGLEENVLLLGALPPSGVKDALQRADAFLLSSLSEGISNAVLEAMSCGLPVVTSDCGGMREAVTDGVEGFVVPMRDPRAAANALMSLARDPELRGRMGQAGRERVIAQFTLSRHVGDFERLCLNAVRSHAMRRGDHEDLF